MWAANEIWRGLKPGWLAAEGGLGAAGFGNCCENARLDSRSAMSEREDRTHSFASARCFFYGALR